MTEQLWEHILQLKSDFTTFESLSNQIVCFTPDGFAFVNSENLIEDAIVIFHRNKNSYPRFKTESLCGDDLYISYKENENSNLINQLKTYCPLIFGTPDEKPFVIVHMAQTMDGKICTNSGKSKWIGNQENLTHAHRVRALVDGVLVGGKTIERDLPRLNVRHVAGNNPARILFSNSFNNWDELPRVENSKTILVRKEDTPAPKNHPVINDVLFYNSCASNDKLSNILSMLRTKGIHSLLIEGGATTAGAFISAGLVDILQFHIAPIIFGSGKSCINLPEINDVKDGWNLKNLFSTPVGNAIMITGELVNKKQNDHFDLRNIKN